MTRYRLAALAAALCAPPAAAAPRDDLLRAAPADAAVVILVQNAGAHAKSLTRSPFAAAFPSTGLGKQLSAGFKLHEARDGLAAVLAHLGTTPDELLTEVFGDAVGFAFSPGPNPTDERAVVLVRPRNPDTLLRVVDRLNALQTGNGELTGVERREHAGAAYSARLKADGTAEFYALRGGVFAFGSSETDVRGFLDRDRTAPPAADQLPAWSAKLAKLGLADAAAVLLVNPRAFDAEMAAKVAAADPDGRPFLGTFGEAWKALDAAAAYVALGDGLEAGVALDFRPGELPPSVRGWLVGARTPSALWAAVPENALAAAAGRVRAAEGLELLRAVLPEKGRAAVEAALGGTLAPVVGRDRLARVLDGLGPDWAVWAEPPADGPLPVLVGAVRLKADVTRAVERAVGFGFEAARVNYNARHPDQITLEEDDLSDGRLTTLVGPKAFPPGVRPAFAVRGGFLVVSTSPEAVRRFRPPSEAAPAADGEAVIARVSGPAVRGYLRDHRDALARLLGGDTADTARTLEHFGMLLEPVDRAELVVRGGDTGLRLAVRVRTTQPLR